MSSYILLGMFPPARGPKLTNIFMPFAQANHAMHLKQIGHLLFSSVLTLARSDRFTRQNSIGPVRVDPGVIAARDIRPVTCPTSAADAADEWPATASPAVNRPCGTPKPAHLKASNNHETD